MEKADQELLMQFAAVNPHLKKLYDEHMRLDKEVEKLDRYAIYSSSAALQQRELKKAKLRTKESIMDILNDMRREEDKEAEAPAAS